MKRSIGFSCLIVAIVLLGTAVPGSAMDEHGKVITPPAPGMVSGPQVVLSPLGDTYLVNVDNEDNAGTGNPDGDMGGANPPCVFDEDSFHPIEFNINVSGALPTTSAELLIDAFDVDEQGGPPPEIDQVYLNGTYLGDLTGADSTWSTTILNVPIALVQAGNNKVVIIVDEDPPGTNDSWCVAVASGQLLIDGGAAGTASCRSLTTDAGQYDFGQTVTATLEVDTTLASQDVQVEVNILDPNGINVAGETRAYTTTDGDDDPQVFNLSLPAAGTAGAYTVQALIFDATGLFESECTVTIIVGQVEPIPATGHTGTLLLIFLVAVAGALLVLRRVL